MLDELGFVWQLSPNRKKKEDNLDDTMDLDENEGKYKNTLILFGVLYNVIEPTFSDIDDVKRKL